MDRLSSEKETSMKHRALEQLQTVANVNLDYPRQAPAISRRERLERWAELLERSRHHALSTLHETEYQPVKERAIMRADDSPISVAFADPVLRAAGLEDDSYGEAKRFFELSDNQLHKLVCYCHFGATVSATTAAHHVRALVAAGDRKGVLARLRSMFAR
jgi:transcriptional regulator of NAD metabolism